MKRPVSKAFVLAVGIVFIMLIAGCGEENLSNVKKHKLIANENRQLKKELEFSDKEIEKQKKSLDECLQKKKVLEEQSREDVKGMMDEIFGKVIEESKKLGEENKNLKAQVQQLEALVRQLEKELQELKKPGPQPLPSTP